MTDLCPICRSDLEEAFTATVLERYKARYQRCRTCGLLRVREPHWLDEAYSSPIAAIDTGLLGRNLGLARRLSAILPLFNGGQGRFLDYAAGYGVLVRLMRDRGFDFWWADKYSSNLMARGFEYDRSLGPCTAVTAFEVLEHVEQPIEFVREAMEAGQSDIFIFTTELYTGDPPSLEWMYYSLESGQHISFYRHDTLSRLAEALGLSFQSHRGIHFFSKRPLDQRKIAAVLSRPGQLIAGLRNRSRGSLTLSDNNLLRTGGTFGRGI